MSGRCRILRVLIRRMLDPKARTWGLLDDFHCHWTMEFMIKLMQVILGVALVAASFAMFAKAQIIMQNPKPRDRDVLLVFALLILGNSALVGGGLGVAGVW
jgi:hypothetical protein